MRRRSCPFVGGKPAEEALEWPWARVQPRASAAVADSILQDFAVKVAEEPTSQAYPEGKAWGWAHGAAKGSAQADAAPEGAALALEPEQKAHSENLPAAAERKGLPAGVRGLAQAWVM